MAKLFLYAAKDSGLDLKVVITTDMVNGDEIFHGHIVPAVKMSDGQYHIIEPQCHDVMERHFQKMLKTPVEKGKTVYDICGRNKPYEVIDIISGEDLEQLKTKESVINKSRRKISVTPKP